jgi:hypothetical protein
VGYIIDSPVSFAINLPGLNESFLATSVTDNTLVKASVGSITLSPGVYILSNKPVKVDANATYADGSRRIGEYVAPEPTIDGTYVLHTAAKRAAAKQPLRIEAQVVSNIEVDSVVVYPSTVSFWSDHNRLYPMTKVGKYQWAATIDASDMHQGTYKYNIVAYTSDGAVVTYPSQQQGTPLSWDYDDSADCYSTMVTDDSIVPLLSASANLDGLEISTIPDQWHGVSVSYRKNAPKSFDAIHVVKDSQDSAAIVLTKYIGDVLKCYPTLDDNRRLCIRFGSANADSLMVGLVNGDGFTYSAPVAVNGDGVASVAVADLRLAATLITPAPYPAFMARTFEPDAATATPLHLSDAITLSIVLPAMSKAMWADIVGIWIE